MKVREIAELVGGQLNGDGDIEITSVADIQTATAGHLAFYEKDGPLPETSASCVIVPASGPANMNERAPEEAATQAESRQAGSVSVISTKKPKLAFAQVAAFLHPPKHRFPEIHESAVIADVVDLGNEIFIGAFVTVGENSVIGNGTQIRAGAKIGDNVSIGENCIIHPNVVIDDGCTVGNNVILYAGVVIGSDGFGYVKDEKGGYIKFPQIGAAVIEDDVEIGANTCIDRGALGETRIGAGTKIDNLVQVGHNVSIGKSCVIAAQTGISGSVTIEDDCVIGGQVGFGDHVTVKSGAVIGSQAGVLPGKIVRPGVWWGTPIQPLDEYKRQNAMVKGLGRLRNEVKELKRSSDSD